MPRQDITLVHRQRQLAGDWQVVIETLVLPIPESCWPLPLQVEANCTVVPGSLRVTDASLELGPGPDEMTARAEVTADLRVELLPENGDGDDALCVLEPSVTIHTSASFPRIFPFSQFVLEASVDVDDCLATPAGLQVFRELRGPAERTQFGFAVALNPESGADPGWLAVGAPSAGGVGLDPEGPGSVHFFTQDGVPLFTVDGDPDAELGFSLAAVGDVTGDGVSDVLVGAPSAAPGGLELAGEAFLLSGATGAEVLGFAGESSRDQFGWAVAGPGDLDGDGVPDLVVGAPSPDPAGLEDAGSLYAFSGDGGALLWRADGEEAGDAFGFAVAPVPDVDGDGRPDLVAGAIGASPGGMAQAGRAYLLSGATGAVIYRLDGPESSASFGFSVASMPDIDGDGVAELIVGAPGASPDGVSRAGSVFIFSGADGTLLRRIDGTEPEARLGTSVAFLEDVDGDGVPDIAVGAHNASPGGETMAGGLSVFSGATGELLQQVVGPLAGAELGWSQSGANTALAVGAPNAPGDDGVPEGLVRLYTLGDELTLEVRGSVQLNLTVDAHVRLPVTYHRVGPL